MIGRREELAGLVSAFEEALATGSCRTAFVVGEPGVGKSRLVAEVVDAVGERARVLRGGCLSYGEGATYWPLAEIVRRAAQVEAVESPDEVRARLRELVASDERADAVAGALADLLGIGAGLTTGGELAWAVRQLLEGLARVHPLVVVLDDLHWAEAPLLELVDGLRANPPAGAMLVLGLARPELLETRPSWKAIRLEPLEEQSSALLVESLLAGAPLDEQSRLRAIASSGGNPLFAEELVAMLLEDPELEIPPTLDALLGARLDLLPADERRAGERGSVEGPVFHAGAVEELSESASEAREALNRLARRELIAPAEPGLPNETAFRFRHILIRDAAYRGIAKRLRTQLHERYADWLERVAGARVAEYAEILAYHLEQAFLYLQQLGRVDERGRALALRAGAELVEVGQRASARGDSGAAASAFSRALDLYGPEAPGRARLLCELAWSRFEIGDIDGARDALAEARSSGEEVATARATIAGVSLRLSTEPGQAQEVLDQAKAAAAVLERAGDELGLARAWRAVGTVSLFVLGRGGEAAEAFQHALAHARRAHAPREELLARGLICGAAARGPMPAPGAIAICERTLAESSGSLLLEALASESLGLLLARSGRFDEARALFATARRNRTDLGQHLAVAGSAEFTGTLELLAGDLDAAERELQAGCEALDRMGTAGPLASVLGLLAEVVLEQGRLDEADRLARRSEELAGADDVDAQIQWRRVRARLLARAGQAEEAAALAEEAVGLALATDALDLQGDAYLALADVSGDGAYLAEAVQCYQAKGYTLPAMRWREQLSGAM